MDEIDVRIGFPYLMLREPVLVNRVTLSLIFCSG